MPKTKIECGCSYRASSDGPCAKYQSDGFVIDTLPELRPCQHCGHERDCHRAETT